DHICGKQISLELFLGEPDAFRAGRQRLSLGLLGPVSGEAVIVSLAVVGVNMDTFTKLYQRLLRIDFSGTAGEALPHGATLVKAVAAGANVLPHVYSDGYAQPLERNLRRLVQLEAARRLELGTVETLAAAVYQHHNGSANSQQLERFLAVISN